MEPDDLYGRAPHVPRSVSCAFVVREVKPHQERWAEAGMVDRAAWASAGKNGFLCPWLPETYGGSGADFGVQLRDHRGAGARIRSPASR